MVSAAWAAVSAAWAAWLADEDQDLEALVTAAHDLLDVGFAAGW